MEPRRAVPRDGTRAAGGGVAPRDLTLGEVTLLARGRAAALGRVRRAESKLARLGQRLALAALAEAEPMSAAPVAVAADARPDGYAAGLSLPTWFRVGVLAVVVAVEYQFWITTGRQSVAYGDYTSPAALQAFAMALLFPVVVAGAMLGAALGRLLVLPIGVRAWPALEAEVNRLLAGYHRGVAAAEARILVGRTRHGLAGRFAALRIETGAAVPPTARTAAPTSWLDVPTPPRAQAVLEPSLRLLEQYRPTDPLAAPQRALPRDSG